MAAAARRSAAKIASAVDEDTRQTFLNSSFEVGPSDAAKAPYLEALRQSIRQRKLLEIDYTNLARKPSARRARPLGLTVFDTVWLLPIWCERARDFRHLRVDRINDVRETGERFRDERGKRFADCLSARALGRCRREVTAMIADRLRPPQFLLSQSLIARPMASGWSSWIK